MFVRNGVPLGSVRWAAVPTDEVAPEVVEEVEAHTVEPEPVDEEPGVEDLDVGSPQPEEPEPEAEPEPDAEPPHKSANKAEWVAFAVTQGADETEAGSLSKGDLIAIYGGE